MNVPEHQIKQFDAANTLNETLTFDEATNLNGAGVQFVYRLPDAPAVIVREATFSNPQPSAGAALTVDVVNIWNLDEGDLQIPGVFCYEWKFVLADGTIMVRPVNAPTDDYPDRKNPAFEVVQSLSSGDEAEGEEIPMANRPVQVANLAELAGLPWSANYKIAFVLSDANGVPGAYTWDASINPTSALAEDPTGSAVVALTSILGGGWRRQGL